MSKRASRSLTRKTASRTRRSDEKYVDLLESAGIHVPNGLSRKLIKQQYDANADNIQTRKARSWSPVVSAGSDLSQDINLNEAGQTASNCVVPELNLTPNVPPSIPTENTNSVVSTCLNTLNSTILALNKTVEKLNSPGQATSPSVSGKDCEKLPTLEELYQKNPHMAELMTVNTPGTLNDLQILKNKSASTPYGIGSGNLTFVDVVSDKLWKNIEEGRDINLATLLIPNYEDLDSKSTKDKFRDPRLSKRLTIEQFRVAFGIYRRILCRKFPFREHELQAYEIDIARIHARYGAKFYDYHLAFSRKAAEAIKLGVIINWGIRDNDELILLIGGTKVRQCDICQSASHETDFCDPRNKWQGNAMSNKKDVSKDKDKTRNDRNGRPIIMHDGKMVCNNFNNQKCDRKECVRLHVCSLCFASNHNSLQCSSNKQHPKATDRTPISKSD